MVDAMTFPAEHLFRRPPNELPDGADPVLRENALRVFDLGERA